MKLLRDEGRCGIVLPDGFLLGEGVKTRIKEKLLSEFNLQTIVRLPNGVFNPYTGINTNILFLRKENQHRKYGILSIRCQRDTRLTAKANRFESRNLT
jgi:type I restriction-modification system DNA methylase subunit